MRATGGSRATTTRAMFGNADSQSGVRNLERQIGKLIRAKAVEYAKILSKPPTSAPYSAIISPSDIIHILGPAPYEREPPASSPPPGIVHGLGYRGSGMGSVLVIEAIQVPGSGKLKLTGSLGEVIRESAELALSWVRMRAGRMGLGEGVFREGDIHVGCLSLFRSGYGGMVEK